MWIETELGIAGQGKNSIVELEQLLRRTLPCLKSLKTQVKLQWWLNFKKQTCHVLFRQKGHVFFFREITVFHQPTFAPKTSDPARRCESNTGDPYTGVREEKRPQRTKKHFFFFGSLDGVRKHQIYRCLSIIYQSTYIRLSIYLIPPVTPP